MPLEIFHFFFLQHGPRAYFRHDRLFPITSFLFFLCAKGHCKISCRNFLRFSCRHKIILLRVSLFFSKTFLKRPLFFPPGDVGDGLPESSAVKFAKQIYGDSIPIMEAS